MRRSIHACVNAECKTIIIRPISKNRQFTPPQTLCHVCEHPYTWIGNIEGALTFEVEQTSMRKVRIP